MTDLRAHLTLPDDFGEPAAGTVVDPPARILLTGATGYLGACLLCSLLERSDSTIVCLVRAAGASEGLARIQLLPVNVGGAVNLLRIAGHTRPKPLHLASSYSVFNDAFYSGVARVMEEPLGGNGSGFRHGYPMSKWIAERVTDLERQRGWSVTTHRLGMLRGDARTGRSKADDVLTLSVRACLTLGCAYDSDSLMHVTPVDFAAGAVAHVALAPAQGDSYYHEITETPIP